MSQRRRHSRHERRNADDFYVRIVHVFVPVADDQDDYDQNVRISESMGAVRVGIRDVQAVSTRVPVSEFCAVCQDVCPGPSMLSLDSCRHVFCEGCITTWLGRSTRCPVCMTEVTTDPGLLVTDLGVSTDAHH